MTRGAPPVTIFQSSSITWRVLPSVDPRAAAMLAHVNLKFSLGALQFPFLVPLEQLAHIQARETHAEVKVTEEHAAQVRHIAYAAPCAPHRVQKRDRANDHHEVLGLDGKQKAH